MEAREQAIFDATCRNLIRHILDQVETQGLDEIMKAYLMARREMCAWEEGYRAGSIVVENRELADEFLRQAHEADSATFDTLKRASQQLADVCYHEDIQASIRSLGFSGWVQRYAGYNVNKSLYLRYLDQIFLELLKPVR